MYYPESPLKIPRRTHIVPCFQPIVSLQTKKVIGYESLGRYRTAEGLQSLGPFFKDESIPAEIHVEYDRELRKAAMEKVAEAPGSPLLFINLKPEWIYKQFQRTKRLPTLDFMRQANVDPNQLVIEITEEAFSSSTSQFLEIIQIYREAGCTIAIDDVGSGFSHFDRIALFQPQIIKIDLRILKKSAIHKGYRALLQSYSILSSQMGASLLLEGIETTEELAVALEIGARYVQGFLFSGAQPEMQTPDIYDTLLDREIKSYTARQTRHYSQFFIMEEAIHQFMHKLEQPIGGPPEANHLLDRLTGNVPDDCIRMYVCKDTGVQVSANYTKIGSHWVSDPTMQGSNWSWRPYFIPNILRMKHRQQGIISHIYTDLESPIQIQTYSYPINAHYYLFLDLKLPEE